MTPSSSARPPTTPPTPPPDAQPGAQVLDALRAINGTLLDKLIEMRDEQKRLETYRTKASGLKDSVKGPVWQRVMDDYTTRLAALEKQAAPLTHDVQREYQKLRALHEQVAAAHDEARLAKEELELREAVGELSKEDLREKLAAPEHALEGYARDLLAIDAQRNRFIDAVGSPAALEPPPQLTSGSQPSSKAPAAEAKAGVTPDVKIDARAGAAAPRNVEAKADVRADAKADAKPVAPAAEPPAVSTEAKTAVRGRVANEPSPDAETVMRVRVDAAKSPVSPSAPSASPSAPVDDSAVTRISSRAAGPAAVKPSPVLDQQTFVLPRAALRVTIPDAEPVEHRLGPATSLGRTEDNQIQISRPGVSRRHAAIEYAPGGFALKDLDSQNGTFLNGDRVTSHALADGDRILIGDAQLVFRLL